MEINEYTISTGLCMPHIALPVHCRELLNFDTISTFCRHNCALTCHKSIFHWDQPGATPKTLTRKHLITLWEGNWREGCVSREAGQHLFISPGGQQDHWVIPNSSFWRPHWRWSTAQLIITDTLSVEFIFTAIWDMFSEQIIFTQVNRAGWEAKVPF